MSRKTIVISEDGMFASEPMSYADVLQLTCSCVAGVAGDILSKVEDNAEREKIEAELFDTANLAFSNCLAHAFPTMELRPDLTEEAIMEAENAILAERAAEIEPEAGEPEKIIPFPTKHTEPAGTYDPNEGCRPVEGEDASCGDDTQN